MVPTGFYDDSEPYLPIPVLRRHKKYIKVVTIDKSITVESVRPVVTVAWENMQRRENAVGD